MEYCLSHHKSPSLPSTLRRHRSHNSSFPRSAVVSIRATRRRKSLTVIAGAGASHCEFSSLNSPLGPRTPAGKDLIGVLLNHPQLFHLAVADELKHLADDRDAARNRMIRSDGSPEACLHRWLSFLILRSLNNSSSPVLCFIDQCIRHELCEFFERLVLNDPLSFRYFYLIGS